MNATSPFIDNAFTPAPGKSAFFLKVMAVLFVHLVFLAALLIEGCAVTGLDHSGVSTPPMASTATQDVQVGFLTPPH